MQRRALLRRIAATAALAGVAGCSGDDGTTTTTRSPTTTTSTTRTEAPDPTDPGTINSTAPLIDADIPTLKLRVDELPTDEDWTLQREDDNSTRFERDNSQAVTGYILEASVLAHTDLETAYTTYREERDRADTYTGITVKGVDLGTASFGYQLTEDSGTVVLRDANVVGELVYTLDYDSTGDHGVSLGEVVGYASLWHATWR
ncbi:MAG: hypothetical protein ABEJ57_06045 [Halobacteriaceae archaeon]